MIRAEEFVEAARRHAFEVYAGVPCSFLTPFINYVIGDEAIGYLSSANEGDAVAAAAGAYLGGRRGVAMMQNSGLGNAVSPLTSLNHVFRIPVLLICTHRGAPGESDEPQHELMGEVTGELFDTMRIPWEVFPQEAAGIEPALGRALAHMSAAGRPYAFLMKKGTVAAHPLGARASVPRERCDEVIGELVREPGERSSREAFLRRIVSLTPLERSVVIATTGYTGRELFALDDRANQLYMVGSMGCASSLALGLALTRPDLEVVALDGDGAGLMRMGNLATAGAYAGANFIHVLLDNEAHESTGGQATVSAGVDFAAVAQACGYAHAWRTDVPETLDAVFAASRRGPAFVHAKIGCGTAPDLPRPDVSPVAVRARLMAHIGAGGER